MMTLWRGELPLSRAFWEYAVLYGLAASLAATAAAAAAVATGLPVVVAVVLYLLPTPYYLVAIVGVWRSADRYRGAAAWASAARVAVVLWTALMTVV
jgi:hypothetical protein